MPVMLISYSTLTPLLQIMTHATAQLEQGKGSSAVIDHMRERFESWQPSGLVDEISLPMQDIAGVRPTSKRPRPLKDDEDVDGDIVVPAQEGSVDVEDEIRPDHIVQVLRITGERIRGAVSADDDKTLESLDGLAARWLALLLTLPTRLSFAKLFQSEPPMRTDSQPVMTQSSLPLTAMVSLLRSIIDQFEEQAGVFVFDPRQVDPAAAVRLIMVNKVILRESGFAEGYLTGPSGFFPEMHPDDLPKMLQALQQAIQTGTASIQDMRMKALRRISADEGAPMQNIWRSADIRIILEQAPLGGRRIGFFRFTHVHDTGEVVGDL